MDVSCECLNIKVYLKTGPFLAGQGWSGVFYEGRSGIAEEIFQGTLDAGGIHVEQPLLIRQVDVQSATPLVSSSGEKIYAKWRQMQCLNCGLWTCSSLISWDERLGGNVPRNSVLLSSRILKRDDWESVTSSADYSPVFRFAIRRRRPDGVPQVGDLLANIVAGLDQQVDRYLRQEQVDVEERIRQVVESEKKRLEAAKARARADRNKLLSAWNAVDVDPSSLMDSTSTSVESVLMDSSSVKSAPAAADFTPPDTPKDMSKHDDDDDEDGDVDDAIAVDVAEIADEAAANVEEPPDTLGPLPSPIDFIDRGDLSLRAKSRRRGGSASSPSVVRLGSSLDAEGLFSLDGMEDAAAVATTAARGGGKRGRIGGGGGGGDRRFGDLDSDDDPSPNDDDDDDDYEDGDDKEEEEDDAYDHGDSVFERNPSSGFVAQSLPISVPIVGFQPRRSSASIEISARQQSQLKAIADMDTDSESPGAAPQNIAESIKALARSVTMASDEEQFLMDLPRPRLRSFKDF